MAAAPSANASGMPMRPAARKNAITHQLMGSSFHHLEGASRRPPEELDEVQEAVRGGDCHGHHEPVGARVQRLHHLVPGELCHLERLPEHDDHQRRAAQRAGLGERAAQRGRYVGEEKLDADVRALADAQRNGEEHAPDEEESRDFLRPVDGGVEAIAQQHLQRHDADHQRARRDDRPAREPVHRVEDAGVELLQVLLLRFGDHPVDEVGADALLHVLDDTRRALAHLLAELRRHLFVGHAALLDLGDRLAFLGRLELVTWRAPSSMKPRSVRPLSANFASSSLPTGPSTTRNACSRESNWKGSEIASSSGTVRDRNAMPTQIICSVPARTFCTFSASTPSCMAGNTSTVNCPPLALASPSRNWFIATLEECSVAKLPASRHFVWAWAAKLAPSRIATSTALLIVVSL